MYCNEDNINIVVDILKQHSVSNVVISPGGTNIPFIKMIQDDNAFSCYSIVDERSAVYFAIGLYLQIKKPIVVLCTSAQATRNYIPGLTEAFYKRVPILALTMEKHPRFKYQEYMQAPDQTSLPIDSVKKSFELPYISDYNDYLHSIRLVNESILELTKDGFGPVQLCVPWLDFKLEDKRPQIRKINRYFENEIQKIDLQTKKVLLAVGEHISFKEQDIHAINDFCERTNTVVYVNHLSNFSNRYSVAANRLLSTIKTDEFEMIKPDILITIGGQTGDYPFYLTFSSNIYDDIEHWRIAEDGKIIDTYDKLTCVFQSSISNCLNNIHGNNDNHSFYKLWKNLSDSKKVEISLPFSNMSIANYLHGKIPKNSIIQFSILNSLRVWNLFEIDDSIQCYSNVGAFGIDGGMSTLIGQSVITDKLSYMIIGDLAFLYDMNSLGIRHIKNNLRILLVNNNGGIEFKLHGENREDVDRYIAAADHFSNAKGWAESCGFIYHSASSMDEFMSFSGEFLTESSSPILIEVFVSDINESEAYNSFIEANRSKNTKEQVKYGLKKVIKGVVGNDKYRSLMGRK